MSFVRKGLAVRPCCAHRRLHLVLLVLAANLFAGCYAFVPTDFSAPEPGKTVRVDISEPGRQALIPRFGPGIQEVEGMTLATSADSMSMLVRAVQTRQGSTGVGNEAVRLTPADVTGVYERRLSRTRSVLLGVGALAAAFVMIDQIASDGRQFSDDDVDPPTPPAIRLPIIGGSGAVFQR